MIDAQTLRFLAHATRALGELAPPAAAPLYEEATAKALDEAERLENEARGDMPEQRNDRPHRILTAQDYVGDGPLVGYHD